MIQPKGKTNTHIPGLQTIKNWFERVGPFGPTPIGMVQDYVYRLIAPEGQAIAIKGLILERRPNCTVYLKVGGALETIFPSEVWCPLLCEIPNLQNDRIARGVRRLAGTPEGFPPVKVIAPQDLTPEVARVLPVFIKNIFEK